jgi:hypothetical protein
MVFPKGGNMSVEIQPPATQSTGRPFLEIPHLWIKYFSMGESFFQSEVSYVSVRNTILGIICLIGIQIILSLVQSGLLILLGISNQAQTSLLFGASRFVSTLCISIFVTPIAFLINIGIIHISSLIFGGKGRFSALAYLVSIFLVPSGVLASLSGFMSFIPVVGVFIYVLFTLGIIIYQYILMVRSIKVIHVFTTSRAVITVLLPFIVLFIVPICLISILALLGPSIGSVFSSIYNSALTPVP